MKIRRLVFSFLAAPFIVLGSTTSCAEATGSIQGGEPLRDSDEVGADSGSTTTWTALYTDFFGPAGTASCSAQTSCHGTALQSGAQTSGFVCGVTKTSCFDGMTKGIPADEGGFFPPHRSSRCGKPCADAARRRAS